MALATSIERSESWQHTLTADGNEEFTLIHYAPWDEVYGPRGPGYRFAELGDILVTSGGDEDERLRLTRIIASPTDNDKEGCRYEQVYTSINKSLKGKVPDLRSSWRASFNTTMITKDVKKQIGAAVGTYDGSAVTTTDEDGEIISQTVYVPQTTYNVTFYASEFKLYDYTTKLGRINADTFFNEHIEIKTKDNRIRDAEGNITWHNPNDVGQWLLSYLNATEIGVQNYEVSMEFIFEPAGWNANPDTMYLTTTTGDCFKKMFDDVKKLYRPDPTVAGRT